MLASLIKENNKAENSSSRAYSGEADYWKEHTLTCTATSTNQALVLAST